ncbi:MAG: di-trans,poly-cis-decaprenylcistransferase [Clostridia bacterium]|nr:di-trans,poly-cis-decaprenylcistransferase [Clostridia bacterium]
MVELKGQDTQRHGADIPAHVGIIMDGNGRWAKSRLLPRSFGHRQGMERMMGLLNHAFSVGVKTVTVYALSTENLSRPKEELDSLFRLFREYFSKYVQQIIEKKSRLCVLGDVTVLPEDVQKLTAKAVRDSAHFTEKCVNVALNYGARDEIIRAVNLAVEKGERVTKESFSSLLYTKGQKDPDLIIRTGNEKRLSNFLLYQAAYSELYFSEKMFPAFSDEDFDEAIKDYKNRTRRFGKV